ncbi:MAG: hypothetical protein EZS28_012273 [Streblomastix strix]|uniref:Uncharacterized protein n=1 Tax=Streblomastix strix TaxID=222440 RepID=A0A5J4WBD0_9EUKA|nr:MAG: hypothetical protein EZS28_012273 [Streblomastix strix]
MKIFKSTLRSSKFKDNVDQNEPVLMTHQTYTIETNGTIIYDMTGGDSLYEYFDIMDNAKFPPLIPGKDENSDSFQIFTDEIVKYLKASQKLDFDFTKCMLLYTAIEYEDYALYGFSAYAMQNANITPSIIYAVESLPEEIFMKFINQDDDMELWNFFYEIGCGGDFDQYILGFELNGIVSDECISNNAIIPGHTDSQSSEMPPKPTVCENEAIPFVQYLQGFKYWWIEQFTVEQFKRVLTRTGVAIGHVYYIDAEDVDDVDDSIFIGWENINEVEYWIIAKQILTYEIIGESEIEQINYHYEIDRIPIHPRGTFEQEIDGFVLFCDGNDDQCPKPYASCAIITSTTPIDRCECPTEQSTFDKDPRKDGLCQCKVIFESTPIDACPCPTDPDKLAKDPRKDGLCKVDPCKSITSTTPIETCPCPTEASSLEKDPRKDGLCQDQPKEQTMKVIPSIMGVILASIAIPALVVLLL